MPVGEAALPAGPEAHEEHEEVRGAGQQLGQGKQEERLVIRPAGAGRCTEQEVEWVRAGGEGRHALQASQVCCRVGRCASREAGATGGTAAR